MSDSCLLTGKAWEPQLSDRALPRQQSVLLRRVLLPPGISGWTLQSVSLRATPSWGCRGDRQGKQTQADIAPACVPSPAGHFTPII